MADSSAIQVGLTLPPLEHYVLVVTVRHLEELKLIVPGFSPLRWTLGTISASTLSADPGLNCRVSMTITSSLSAV